MGTNTYFPNAWKNTIREIITTGIRVAPRGRPTMEILQHTISIDMTRPVLNIDARKLSYKFMAAEAFWILLGSDLVVDIAGYNSRIADFSDDGKKFFGAYGPKIVSQMDYVVGKLVKDRDTRQAGLTLWRENPPETKDVPCTIAMFFNIREHKLNAHVFMRSSDVWLGLPYDVFNFSMVAHKVCAMVNMHTQSSDGSQITVPGTLFLTAASSHLYEDNYADAVDCLQEITRPQNQTPETMYLNSLSLDISLMDLRDTKFGDALRWWEERLGN
jgi:thymidylate synthase